MQDWAAELGWTLAGAIAGVLIEIPFYRYRQRLELLHGPAEDVEPPPAKWDWIARGVGLVIFALVLGGVYVLLNEANQRLARAAGPYRTLLLPGVELWLAYALFAGLFAGFCCVAPLMRLVMDSDEWRAWRQFHRGAFVFAQRVAVWVMLPFTAYVAPHLTMHTALEDHAIRARGFGEWNARRWPYDKVERLFCVEGIIAPIGSYRERPHVVIQFSGGARWNSEDTQGADHPVEDRLIEFLEKKTGRTCEQRRLLN